MPQDEKAFVGIIAQAYKDYRRAGNDIQREAARPDRARKLCAQFESLKVKNWVGVVDRVDKTSVEGLGILAIKIGGNITLLTPQNFLGELSPGEMIPASSPMMKFLAKQREGTKVVFSGSFYRGNEDCFQESSITDEGSLSEPDFDFKFYSVGPYFPQGN